MVFVRTLFLKDTKLIYLPEAASLNDCRRGIEAAVGNGFEADSLAFYANGKRVDEDRMSGVPLENHATVDASLILGGLLGGKGGFGSMLRALGAQIEKTTNKEACRDLSGRRLRDINEEKRLKKYVDNQAEREREKAEKKEAKMQKLKRIVDPKATGNGGKHEFHDPKYNKERAEATERVHDAMDAVFKKAKQPEATVTSGSLEAAAKVKASSGSGDDSNSNSSSSSSSFPTTTSSSWSFSAGSGAIADNDDKNEAGPSGTKRKAEEEKPGPSKPKKGLWVGDGLTESDLEDSSDEDDDTGENKNTSAK